jgi:hypothetical protein
MNKKRGLITAALLGCGLLLCGFAGRIPDTALAVQCATAWTVLLFLMPAALLVAALLFPDLFPGV